MNAKNKLTDRVKNISDTPVHHEIIQEDHKEVIPKLGMIIINKTYITAM